MVQLKIGEDVLSATLEHPFRVAGRGWVEAGKLKVGDCIESTGKECQPVAEKQLIQGAVVVYNFTVQSAHTYFVGDGKWWVHNNTCFPSDSRLAEELGIRERDIHAVKKEILKEFGQILEKMRGFHNPDIGITDEGFVALRSRVTKAIFETTTPIENFVMRFNK